MGFRTRVLHILKFVLAIQQYFNILFTFEICDTQIRSTQIKKQQLNLNIFV